MSKPYEHKISRETWWNEDLKKDNFIMIEPDSLRADFLSCYGFPLETSPDIDNLAEQGVLFQKAYTPVPITVPANMSIFTGRYPEAHGIRTNQPLVGSRFSKDLLQVFREAGYNISLIGRPGLYLLYPYGPSSTVEPGDYYTYPYEHHFGPLRKDKEKIDQEFNTWMNRLNHWIGMEPTPFPVHCQYPVRIIEDTITYLRDHKKEPFFLRCGLPEPHSPYQAPKPYWDMFPPDKMPDRIEVFKEKGFPWDWQLDLIHHYHPEYVAEKDEKIWRRMRSNYCGIIKLLNDEIRKLLQFLDSSGLSENTHVFFFADHGNFQGDFGQIRKGVGVPECLMRVPFIWKGPNIQCNKIVKDSFISLVDIMPTICDIIGVKPPLGTQGRSFAPILYGTPYSKEEFDSIYGETGTGGRRVTNVNFDHPTCVNHNRAGGKTTYLEINIATQSGQVRMVRKGDWKLVVDWEKSPKLYNIVDDPAEINNLFEDTQYRKLSLEMIQSMFRWMATAEERFPTPVINFTEWQEYLKLRNEIAEKSKGSHFI